MTISSCSSSSSYYPSIDYVSHASSSTPVEDPSSFNERFEAPLQNPLLSELVSLGFVDAHGKITPAFAESHTLPPLDEATLKKLYALRVKNTMPQEATPLTIAECFAAIQTLGAYSPISKLMLIGGSVRWILGWRYYCNALKSWGVKTPEHFFSDEMKKRWDQEPPDSDFEAFSGHFHKGFFKIIQREMINALNKKKRGQEEYIHSLDPLFSKRAFNYCNEFVQGCSIPLHGVDINFFKNRKSEYLSGHNALKIPCSFIHEDSFQSGLDIVPTNDAIHPLQAFFDELLQQLNPTPSLDDRGWIRQIQFIQKGYVVRDPSVIQQLRSYKFDNFHQHKLDEWISELLVDCEKSHPTEHPAGIFITALIAISLHDFRQIDSAEDNVADLIWSRLITHEKWSLLSEPVRNFMTFLRTHRQRNSDHSIKDSDFKAWEMFPYLYHEESLFRSLLLNSLEYIVDQPYRKMIKDFDREFTVASAVDPYALWIKVIFRNKRPEFIPLLSFLLSKKDHFQTDESYKETVKCVFGAYQKRPSKQGIHLLDQWIRNFERLTPFQFVVFCRQVHPLLSDENRGLLKSLISLLSDSLELFFHSRIKGGEESPVKTEVMRGIIESLIYSPHYKKARSLLSILQPDHPFTRLIRGDIEQLQREAAQAPAFAPNPNVLPPVLLGAQTQIEEALINHDIAKAHSTLYSVVNLGGNQAVRIALRQLTDQIWDWLSLRLETPTLAYICIAITFTQQESLHRRFPRRLVKMHLDLVEKIFNHSELFTSLALQEFIFDSLTKFYGEIPVEKQGDYILKMMTLLRSTWRPQTVIGLNFKQRLETCLLSLFQGLNANEQIQLLLLMNLYSMPINESTVKSDLLLELIEKGIKSNTLPLNDQLSLLTMAKKTLDSHTLNHSFERMLFFADCFFDHQQFDSFFKCFSFLIALPNTLLREKKNDLIERLSKWIARLPEDEKATKGFDLLDVYREYNGPTHVYENLFSPRFIQQSSQCVIQFLMNYGSDIALCLSSESRETLIEKMIDLKSYRNTKQQVRRKGRRRRETKEQEIDETPLRFIFSFLNTGEIAKSRLWKKALEKISPFSQELKNYAFQMLSNAIEKGLLEDDSLLRIECWRLSAHTHQACTADLAHQLLKDGSLINRVYLRPFSEEDPSSYYQEMVTEYHSLYKLCFASMSEEKCASLVQAHGRLCTSRIYMLETIDFWGINEELFKQIQHHLNAATFELFQNTLLNLSIFPNKEMHLDVLSQLARVELKGSYPHDPVIQYINELECKYRDQPWCVAVLAEAADSRYPERLRFILKLIARFFDFIKTYHDKLSETALYNSRKQYLNAALGLLIRAVGATHRQEVCKIIFHPATWLMLRAHINDFIEILLRVILLNQIHLCPNFHAKEKCHREGILNALDFYEKAVPHLSDFKTIEKMKFRIFEEIRDYYKAYHEAEGTAALLIDYAKITVYSITITQPSENDAGAHPVRAGEKKRLKSPKEILQELRELQEQEYYRTLQKLIHLFNSKSVNSTMLCPSMIGFCMLSKLLDQSKAMGYKNIEYIADLLDLYIFEFDCSNPNEFSIFRTLSNQLLEHYLHIARENPHINFFHFPHMKHLEGVHSMREYFLRMLMSKSSPIRAGAIDLLLHLAEQNTEGQRAFMQTILLLHLSSLKENPLERIYDKNLIVEVCDKVSRYLSFLIQSGLPDDLEAVQDIASVLIEIARCLPPMIDSKTQLNFGVIQIDVLVRLAHIGVFENYSEKYWEIVVSFLDDYIKATKVDLSLYATKIFSGLLVTNHEIVKKCPLITEESKRIYYHLHQALIIEPLHLIKTPFQAKEIFEALTSVQWRNLLPETKDVEMVKERLAKIIYLDEQKAARSVQSKRLRQKKS